MCVTEAICIVSTVNGASEYWRSAAYDDGVLRANVILADGMKLSTRLVLDGYAHGIAGGRKPPSWCNTAIEKIWDGEFEKLLRREIT